MNRSVVILTTIEGVLLASTPWVIQAAVPVRLVVGALLVLIGAAAGVLAWTQRNLP